MCGIFLNQKGYVAVFNFNLIMRENTPGLQASIPLQIYNTVLSDFIITNLQFKNIRMSRAHS